MAYSNFRNLKKVADKFSIEVANQSLFKDTDITLIQPSEWLKTSMEMADMMGFYSEKERSERLVHPVLAELVTINKAQITLYSGQELNIDKELTGECDYLMTIGHKIIDFISTPLFSVVEAKKQDIEHGTAQCTAQMIGAERYNKLDGVILPYIYGATTDGQKWRFMKLENQILTIHPTYYYLSDLSKLISVFAYLIDDCRKFKIQKNTEGPI
jgi:hypothetical protein